MELGGHVWNGGLVPAAAPEELDAFQQISDHPVDGGGVGLDLLQLQHFGVEDTAESGPLWSCAAEQRSVSSRCHSRHREAPWGINTVRYWTLVRRSGTFLHEVDSVSQSKQLTCL